jgi:L-lactate permease
LIGLLLALIPLAVMFAGIIVFKWTTHKAGLLSTLLAIGISFAYSGTSIQILIMGWVYGILVTHKYTLAYVFSFFLTFYMMTNGCFDVIRKAMKRMPGGIVFKIYFLCFGLGILMLSAGAGIDWIAVVLDSFGIGAWAVPILVDGSCDAFSQFAYLATPITVPVAVYGKQFGFTEADLASLLGRFMWFTIPMFTLAILWVLKRDGVKVNRVHAVAVASYGLILAAVANFLLGSMSIMGVGVMLGVFAVLFLLVVNVVGARMGYFKPEEGADTTPMTGEEKSKLIRSISPLIIVSVITSVVSLPPIAKIIDPIAISIPIIADQSIPFQVFQPYVWCMVSILLSFLIIKPTKETIAETNKLLVARFVPFLLALVTCGGIVFTYNWSGMVVNAQNKLVLPPERVDLNLINSLANAASQAGPTFYVVLVPFLAIFGCMIFGSELSSTLFFTKFHFVAAKTLGIAKPLVLVAGHIISNLGIVDVRKMARSLAIIGAYGEEWKTMRFTFLLGFIITVLIVPLLFYIMSGA